MKKIKAILLKIYYVIIYIAYIIVSGFVEITKNKKNILKIKFSLGTFLIIITSNIAFYTTSCQKNDYKNAKKIVSNSSKLVTSKQVIIKEKVGNQTVEEKNVFYEDENVVFTIEDTSFVENKYWITCYEPVIQEPEVYLIVEEMPEFPGGEVELRKFIAENLRFPEIYYEADIHGKVYIRFVINEKGEVENPEVVRGIDSILDEEALRVVKLLPNFIPGKQNGKNVSVWYTVPVELILR